MLCGCAGPVPWCVWPVLHQLLDCSALLTFSPHWPRTVCQPHPSMLGLLLFVVAAAAAHPCIPPTPAPYTHECDVITLFLTRVTLLPHTQVDVVLSPHLWLRNAQRRAAAQEAESGSEATVTAAGRSSMTQHGAVAGPASSSRTCCSSSGSSAAGGACSKGAEHGTGLALSGAACSRSQHAGAADRGMRGQMSDGTAGSTQAGEGIRRGLGAWLQGLVPDGNKGL